MSRTQNVHSVSHRVGLCEIGWRGDKRSMFRISQLWIIYHGISWHCEVFRRPMKQKSRLMRRFCGCNSWRPFFINFLIIVKQSRRMYIISLCTWTRVSMVVLTDPDFLSVLYIPQVCLIQKMFVETRLLFF